VNRTLKVIICLVFIVFFCFSLYSCNKICEIEETENRIRQQTAFFAQQRGFSHMLKSEREIIELEDGTVQINLYPSQATQRLIDMYNYILRKLEPQVLFNDRDIVLEDIFDTTVELQQFIWKIEESLGDGSVLSSRAFPAFLRAWYNGYIDHDDVDGCWRGNGDWSEEIDEWIAQSNERRRNANRP